MTTDDRDYYSPEDFGDTYYENEHYGPGTPDADSDPYNTENDCSECDRPITASDDLCADCERELEEANAHPDAYAPVFDEIAVGYEPTVDDIAFAVVPACSRYEAIIKATHAFHDRETIPDLPTDSTAGRSSSSTKPQSLTSDRSPSDGARYPMPCLSPAKTAFAC